MFTTWNVCFLGLDGGKVWVGWLCGWAGGYCSSYCCGLAGYVAGLAATAVAEPANPHLITIKTQEADVPCGEQ
jgi:hypothetical protein